MDTLKRAGGIAWLVMLAAASSAWADATRIVLKASVQCAGTAERLTVADVADVSGDERTRVEGLAVLNVAQALRGGSPKVSVAIADVREALESAGVNLGRIELSGSSCEVQLPAKASQVQAKPRAQNVEPRVHQAVDMSGPTTIRTRIAVRIGAMLNVGPEELRLLFDEDDEELLQQAVGSRRIDVQPASGAASGRVPMHVTGYEGDRVVLSRLVGVGVLVKRTVVTATQVVERGALIAPDQIEVSERWVSPANKPSADAESVRGAVASVRLQPGQVIGTGDVGQPVVCKRGDIVYVHALSGGITVKAKARAMTAARDGETVQLKLDGSERVFSARMNGPGRAVVLISPTEGGTEEQGSSSAVFGAPTEVGHAAAQAHGKRRVRPAKEHTP